MIHSYSICLMPFSFSLPILSSASLLAYQDWECMEKQKHGSASYKRGGGLQSMAFLHTSISEACWPSSVHFYINLIIWHNLSIVLRKVASVSFHRSNTRSPAAARLNRCHKLHWFILFKMAKHQRFIIIIILNTDVLLAFTNSSYCVVLTALMV